MLLPEELAPQLGVKSTGLHFLTAGNQGVWGQARAGSGDWGWPRTCESQQPLSPHRCAARVGGGLRAMCPHAAAVFGPWAGADPLRPGPSCWPAPQCHC